MTPTKHPSLLANNSSAERVTPWTHFRNSVLEAGKLTEQFQCKCAVSCFNRRLKLTTNQLNTPAKIDLTYNKYSNLFNTGDDNYNPYFSSSNIRIIISKRETETRTTVAYTPLMVVADLANILGLFFGFSVIASYEALERTASQSTELLLGKTADLSQTLIEPFY